MKTLQTILLSSETPEEQEQTKKNMDKMINKAMNTTKKTKWN